MGCPWRDEQLLRHLYWEEKMSQAEIADRLDCGVSTITKWMGINGIPSRDRIEASRSALRKEYAHFSTRTDGYELWKTKVDGDDTTCYVHRLVAVAEYGFDEVTDNDIHHGNDDRFGPHGVPIPWANWRENVVPLS